MLGFAIVGLMSSVMMVFVIRRAFTPSPSFEALAAMHAIHRALDLYHRDTGMYPTTQAGVAALRSLYPGGPYIAEDLAVDPWGRPYLYSIKADGSPTVATLGADGQPGGIGPDVDLVIEHGQAAF